MKKHYDLSLKEGKYQLEGKETTDLFSIEADLQFDVKLFYQVIFEDVVESCEIKITNKCDVEDKTGKRIYDTLVDVSSKICKRLNEECFGKAGN